MARLNQVRMPAMLVLLVLLMPSMSRAAVEAGKVLYARGIVSIIDEQDSRRGGEAGSVVYEGERVVTGRNAVAQIRLSDGALVALRHDSDYLIEKQRYDEQQDLYEQAGRLFTGWMRSITGVIGGKYPGNVRQSTTVATIGIRGTVYQMISIPEGGLPGYPSEEPGTYVLLEAGEIEITAEGATRLLHPGDVVFVPASGGAPVLAPERADMFERPERGDVRRVETDDERPLHLNETLLSRLASPRAALGFFDGTSYLLGPAHLKVVNINGAPAPVGMLHSEDQRGESISREVRVRPGQGGPDGTGRHTLADGSRVNWGLWTSSQYLVSTGSGEAQAPLEDWHYMLAENVVTRAADLDAGGLRGNVSYSLVGGTPFTGGLTTISALSAGSIDVNFGGREMFVDLQFDSGASISNYDVSFEGQRTIEQFYQGGLSLSIDPANETTWGTISGAFVGDGQGIATAISVSETAGTSYGTALFEQDGAAVEGDMVTLQ